MENLTHFLRARRLAYISACILLLGFIGTGCVSQKPLPYRYSTPKPAMSGGPSLTVRPTLAVRPKKDVMGKCLDLPACLDVVIVKELEGAGLFQAVTFQTNAVAGNAYVLESNLGELRWEVPRYDQILGTAFLVSFCTGGIGGIIYGCTDTEVLGHSAVHFTLKDSAGQSILDRDYSGKITTRKVKFSCDTPDTYREVAADSFKIALDKFKDDLQQVNLK